MPYNWRVLVLNRKYALVLIHNDEVIRFVSGLISYATKVLTEYKVFLFSPSGRINESHVLITEFYYIGKGKMPWKSGIFWKSQP